MYRGEYNGSSRHPSDLQAVLRRAADAGVDRIIVTAGSLVESRAALALARTSDHLFCTAGLHPTRCGEPSSHPGGPDAYFDELAAVLADGATDGKCVAVGECGLDYDRLRFCDAETQKEGFERHFALASASGLPMFLHMRAAAADFVKIVAEHRGEFRGGVVHSFDGSTE
jgi:TatD DNase family protein